MNNNKGIAIAGMWIGVGICSFNLGMWTILIAFFACISSETIMKN